MLELPSISRRLLLGLLLGLQIPHSAALAAEPEIKGWITLLDGAKKTASLPQDSVTRKECATPPSQTHWVTIDPTNSFQSVAGFGAALTESSAILLGRMSEASRKKLLSELFSESGALRLNILRVPVGATDFSTGNFSCADSKNDRAPKSVKVVFDLKKCMGKILPILSEIKLIRPDLKIIATPWSPPAWMKSNKSMVGGKLLPRHYPEYAEYLSLFLEKMKEAGSAIDYLTIVNEPLYVDEHGVTYPWMNMQAEEQATFIGKFLGPMLKKKGLLEKVRLLGYDHNWDQWNYPSKLLTHPESGKYLTGTAFHCYKGNYTEAGKVKEQFPAKEIHLTECTSGKWSPSFDGSFAWAMNNLVIGHFSVGAQSLVYWNLLLDAEGGPKNGGCQDCRGIINLKAGGTETEKSPEYHVLAQVSAVADPGAVRVLATSSRLKDQIAFQNPDRSLGWLGINTGDSSVSLEFKSPRGCLSTIIPAKSTVSLRW